METPGSSIMRKIACAAARGAARASPTGGCLTMTASETPADQYGTIISTLSRLRSANARDRRRVQKILQIRKKLQQLFHYGLP